MRIEFDQSTPLGTSKVTLMTDGSGVNYEADGPTREALRIPWASITSAGTVVFDFAPVRKRVPTVLAQYMQRREMLVLAYRESIAGKKSGSIPLPAGPERDALVAEVRSSLGSRWIGEGVPYQRIENQLGLSSKRRTALVWLFILGVAVAAFIFAVVGAGLLAILLNDYLVCLYVFVGGGFLFRHGFLEYKKRLVISNTPTAKASSAAIGLAELFGKAHGSRPTPAPITGKMTIFWKVEVRKWKHAKGQSEGSWQTLLDRESQPLDTLELEDETGRVLVWTHGAELILQSQRWQSKDQIPLPDPGMKLLSESQEKWPPPSDQNYVVVTEKRLEEGGPLYVMGTLAERSQVRSVPTAKPVSSTRVLQQINPGVFRAVSALGWALLKQGVQTKIQGPASFPPDIEPHRVLVWKGDQGRPFIIADRPERQALTALSKRMWLAILLGAGLMAGALYAFLDKAF